ncbi:hypothetical protein PPYR_15249 [Photinus pyralis]|uniref:Regulatory protein zeste n=1 Tax=Photinus pyralis TaxID=7054 RepID=A0A5N3ZZ89_PHOPY|nr:hypothetical protein PPYR_15249 [Photinus pyralis]
MATKRQRTINFSEKEVRLLTDICLKYSSILENKKTDAVTWKEKNTTWEQITAEFNSQNESSNYRDTKNLRLKYDCLKREIKAKKAKNKLEIYKTGGGKPEGTPYTDYEEKILDVITLSLEGLPCRHDSDNALIIDNGIDMVETLPFTAISNLENIPFDIPLSEIDIAAPVARELETSIIPSTSKKWTSGKKKRLQPQERQYFNKKYEQITNNRTTLITLQTENAEWEKQLLLSKIKFAEEEYMLKMKLLKLNIRKAEINLLQAEKGTLE